MFQRLLRKKVQPNNFREYQDQSKLRWSNKKKAFAYLCFGAMGLKIFTSQYKTDILYTFQPTRENMQIIESCPTLRKGIYQPTFYLLNSFSQVVYGSLFDSVPFLPLTREQITVDEEGGSINLDYLPIHHKYVDETGTGKPNMRILIVFHGLTGGSECNYIRQTALFASRRGFRTICVNMRGYAETKLTSPKMTDFSSLNDFQKAIQHIMSQYPQANIYALGFSMGSNLLLRYLEQDQSQSIKGAVAISVPWNFQELSQSVSSPRKFIYNWAITRNFQRNLKWNIDIFNDVKVSKGLDIDGALKVRQTRKYDELITTKLLGYEKPDDLYAKIDCTNTVKNITTPLLMISSLDDPIIPATQIPKNDIYKNPNLILALTRKGGHIEWFQGSRPQRWFIRPSVEYLDHIDKIQRQK